MAKKRCNGEGSINKRKDGRWECSIMFGFQKDGRRRRKSFYGRTRKEALDKMHDFKQKLEAGLITLDERPLVQPDILFSQWADTWYEGHKDSISKTTSKYILLLYEHLETVEDTRFFALYFSTHKESGLLHQAQHPASLSVFFFV